MTTMKTRRETEARSIAEQAAEWLLIMEMPTDADREDFSTWLAQSPQHVGAFLRASAVDALIGEVDPNREIPVEVEGVPHADPKVVAFSNLDRCDDGPATADAEFDSPLRRGTELNTAPRRGFGVWAIAASAVLALVFGVLVLGRGFSTPSKHYTAAVGEQRTITLSDGSVMYLAPGSSVDVMFENRERRVQLVSGAAMFKVHHDAGRPFRVHGGRAVVEAVGTQFNVSLVRGDSLVSVTEGVVQVSHEPSLLEKLSPVVVRSDRFEVKPVRLAAGQETRVADDGRVAKPRLAAADPMKDWKARRLTFINETLFAIADEFNRYNLKPKIRIHDAAVGELRYAAAFDADDPESLVTVLEKNPDLAIERHGDEIVIRGR